MIGYGDGFYSKLSPILSTNTYKTNNGPLIKTLYGNNYLKHYYYNNLGLVRSIRGKASGATAETELYNFEYNSTGTQTAYIDKVNNTKILYDYDSLGRLRSTETVTNTNAFIGLAEYGYDSRNNLTRLATLYDGAPREEKFYYIQVSGNEHSDDYEKDNLPTRYQIYDSRYALYSYDSLNRLTERKFTLNAPLYYNYLYKASDRNSENSKKYQTTQVAEEFIGNDVYGYTYGIMGNITHIKTAQRTGSAGNSSNHSTLSDYVSYKYDKLGQLTEENFSGGRKTQWTYDELGNITSKVVTKNGTTKTIAYQYGAGTYNVGTDEETSSWNYLLTEFDGKTITYDKIGNPTSYLGATLTWSGRQLDSYTKGTNAITYTYNSDGLRASKTVNGVKSDYYYVNGRLHYEKRSDGSSLRFFYDSYGYLTVIEHKTTAAGIKSYYVATNLRGDVVALYKGDGTCIAKYEYDAWGNTLSVKDASNNPITDAANIANVNPIRYRGYYYDTETKLYYLQSRYYNPEVGRFLNADGYITTGQGVLSYNMFAYCKNNPVMYSDSSGDLAVLTAIVCGIIAVCTVVGAIMGASSDERLSDKPKKEKEKTRKESNTQPFLPFVSEDKQTQESVSTNYNRTSQTKTSKTELTTKDRVENALVGASLGLAVGGAISMVVAMPAIVIVGPATSAQAFCTGALAFDFVAICVAPFLNIDLEPVEWDSVDIDNSNYMPTYGIYE